MQLRGDYSFVLKATIDAVCKQRVPVYENNCTSGEKQTAKHSTSVPLVVLYRPRLQL